MYFVFIARESSINLAKRKKNTFNYRVFPISLALFEFFIFYRKIDGKAKKKKNTQRTNKKIYFKFITSFVIDGAS